MLNSIGIKNFRSIEDLQIPSLTRINLITGKNNTGKSTLLDAIFLYAKKGRIQRIVDFLKSKDEFYFDEDLKSLSALFFNRKIGFFDENKILIGSLKDKDFLPKDLLSIRLVKYYNNPMYEIDKETNEQIFVGNKRVILTSENENVFDNEIKIGFEVKVDFQTTFISIEDSKLKEANFFRHQEAINILYLPKNVDNSNIYLLWDSVALTEKEENVIDALKIIEKDIDRLTFVSSNFNIDSSKRIPVVKIKNIPDVLPLKSMGDVINRILEIILALVNADNGFLLIDEIENGLHYSVQEKLWKIIFDLATKLNIQVFVTTHSNDCINAFEKVMNENHYTKDGKLIRLDKINNKIKQVEFDASELQIASEQNIELR